MKTISLISILIFGLTACGLGGGTHGYIKGYEYPVTKLELDKVINNIIESDSNIRRDFRAGHYNDTKNYITMNIKSPEGEVEYIFRYLGDSTSWNNSSSEIFLCYIYDGKGNGGSAGNGKWEDTDSKIQESLINLFETKFVSKISKELNQTPAIRP